MDVAALLGQLEALLCGFVGQWGALKAHEERVAAEEAEMFKTKTRETNILNEEVGRVGGEGMAARPLAPCSMRARTASAAAAAAVHQPCCNLCTTERQKGAHACAPRSPAAGGG